MPKRRISQYFRAGKRPAYVRRKFNAKRKFSRRRTAAYSSTKGGSTSFYFKNRRKLGSKKFRKQLWRSTQGHGHLRSYGVTNSQAMTPANSSQMNLAVIPMLPAAFYTSGAGGGQAVHTPDDNFILRGGVSSATFYNVSTLNVRVRVWKIWAKEALTLPSPITYSWDPSLVADFNDKFKICGFKEFILEPQDCIVMKHRHLCRRIDKSRFDLGLDQMYWVAGFCNLASAASIESRFIYEHNVSFADTN